LGLGEGEQVQGKLGSRQKRIEIKQLIRKQNEREMVGVLTTLRKKKMEKFGWGGRLIPQGKHRGGGGVAGLI